MSDEFLLDAASIERLREYYGAFTPSDSARLVRTIDARLVGGADRRRLTSPRLAPAFVALAAAIVLVVAGGFWVRGQLVAPAATSTASPTVDASPSATRTTEPSPSAGATSPAPSYTPHPSLDPAAATSDAPWTVGRVRTGGLWMVDYETSPAPMYLSTDGATWSRVGVPVTTHVYPSIYVFDREHIWSIGEGAGTANPTDQAGTLRLVVNRTADGGRTWRQSAVLPGNYVSCVISMSFVDAQHGFLLASTSSLAVPERSPTTLLGTSDGGATWTLVAALPLEAQGNVGGNLDASDASTLWAGAQGEAKQVSHPLLEVSRDGGKTWKVASPEPAIAGGVGGEAHPRFFSATEGAVVVRAGSGAWTYRTSDAGRTWSKQTAPEQTEALEALPGGSAYALGGDPWSLQAATAGSAWHPVAARLVPMDWVDAMLFTDALHGLLLGGWTAAPGRISVTADGGLTWGAPFASPQTQRADATDVAAVKALVSQFEVANTTGRYDASWAMLAPSQQAGYGGEAAWAAARQHVSPGSWTPYSIGDPYWLRRDDAGDDLWKAIGADADLSRAYGIGVNHPDAGGASAGGEVLAVAPLLDGSGWRIWLLH